MASRWHPDQGAEQGFAPTEVEIEIMAAVLEARHGGLAAEVAEFFALLHGQNGNVERSCTWNGVAEQVRQREQRRLIDDP